MQFPITLAFTLALLLLLMCFLLVCLCGCAFLFHFVFLVLSLHLSLPCFPSFRWLMCVCVFVIFFSLVRSLVLFRFQHLQNEFQIDFWCECKLNCHTLLFAIAHSLSIFSILLNQSVSIFCLLARYILNMYMCVCVHGIRVCSRALTSARVCLPHLQQNFMQIFWIHFYIYMYTLCNITREHFIHARHTQNFLL